MASFSNRAAIFSFIDVEEDEFVPYTTQKQLLAKSFQTKQIFENGELLETLEKRALYPMIYCSSKALNEIKDVALLRSNSLGENILLRQGIYVESKRHQAPRVVPDSVNNGDVAYIFMGFKSVDIDYNENLEESWKDWTGARLVNACLRQEFYISRFSFFHRIKPPDPELFMYVLLVECHNVRNTNATYLLDFVQKMRVERVFGNLTVYRRENLSSTSAIIKGLLSEQDEYVNKVDI